MPLLGGALAEACPLRRRALRPVAADAPLAPRPGAQPRLPPTSPNIKRANGINRTQYAAKRVVLRKLFSSAEVLRMPFAKPRSRRAKRRTSPALARHSLLTF